MSRQKLKELARLGLLGLVAAWLLHPFATSRMYGAGDALWYANVLADYILQIRSGIFPVFSGQTEFAFNGAVFPLRVAPLYQHLAGLLDLLTGRSMGFIAIQHLEVIVCGVAGLFACYYTLCQIAPKRRWEAVAFACLYLACPGILGTIYSQDLYMTWMTVPFAPLAAYGIFRTYKIDDIWSQLWLAAPQAALWWGHSPIALWFTFIAAASQLIRLSIVHRGLRACYRSAAGVVIFVVLVQYLFVSVSVLKTRGDHSGIVGSLAHPEMIIEFVNEAFPGSILPVSARAGKVSDLQLGYSLWVTLSLSTILGLSLRRKDLMFFCASAGLLLILVLPVPGATAWLWRAIPSAVVRVTYYWPMQRFYLICAALIVAAGQIALSESTRRRSKVSFLPSILLAVGCAWSLLESRRFVEGATDRLGTAESSARVQLSENLILMDHAYGLFPRLPSYFSNGVVDIASEVRLWSKESPKVELQDATVLQRGRLVGIVDANPGILDLGPTIHIEKGHRYWLEIDFAHENVQGILQLRGLTMWREYSLPSSGESRAFGSTPGNSRQLDLWTSNLNGDDVTLRFITMASNTTAKDFKEFGRFELKEPSGVGNGVTVLNMIPLTLRVNSVASALVETPRVFMPGYQAEVDGKEATVSASTEGLAQVPINAGSHEVILKYRGPWVLMLSYWVSVAAWFAVFSFLALSQLVARNSSVPSQ